MYKRKRISIQCNNRLQFKNWRTSMQLLQLLNWFKDQNSYETKNVKNMSLSLTFNSCLDYYYFLSQHAVTNSYISLCIYLPFLFKFDITRHAKKPIIHHFITMIDRWHKTERCGKQTDFRFKNNKNEIIFVQEHFSIERNAIR